MNSLIRNATFNIIKMLASLIFPLITFSYVSRILLAEGIGELDFAKSYISYFTILAMLGIVNYGTREGSRVRKDKEKLSKLAQELLIINGCSVVFAYIIMLYSISIIPKLQSYQFLLLINSLSILLTAFGMEWLYNAVEDYRYIALRTCAFQAISLILMLCFVKTRDDAWKYAVIQIFAASGNNIMNLIHSKKYISYKKKYTFNIKSHIKPITILFFTTLSIQVFTHLDSTMLGFMVGNKSVGLYSAASKMSGLAAALITSVTLVLMPRIAYYIENGQIENVKVLINHAINFILLIGIPSSIGLCMVSRYVINVFSGNAFMEADFTTKIMALRVLLVPLNSFIAIHLFIPLGKDKSTLIATSSAALLNFFLNTFLIPRFIQNGAAIATVAAEGIELVINLLFLSKLINVWQLFEKSWQYMLAGLSIIPLVILADRFISNSYIALCLIIWTSAISYFLILYILKNRYIHEGIAVMRRKCKSLN